MTTNDLLIKSCSCEAYKLRIKELEDEYFKLQERLEGSRIANKGLLEYQEKLEMRVLELENAIDNIYSHAKEPFKANQRLIEIKEICEETFTE